METVILLFFIASSPNESGYTSVKFSFLGKQESGRPFTKGIFF